MNESLQQRLKAARRRRKTKQRRRQMIVDLFFLATCKSAFVDRWTLSTLTAKNMLMT